MTARSLAGKVAVVTGATKGIGRAITLGLAEAGATIVGTARNAGPAAQLAEDVRRAGGKFAFEQSDVTSWAQCQDLAEKVRADHGGAHILVNNAGTSLPHVSLDKITEADWRAVIGVTLEGTVFMSRAFLPGMIERQDGVIINIASTAGVQAAATMGVYATAKAGVIQFTKILAVENFMHGIRANALLVGATETELEHEALAAFRTAPAPDGPPQKSRGLGRIRLQPEGVAGAVRMLCSDDAREINGAEINLDRALLAGSGHTVLVQAIANGLNVA